VQGYTYTILSELPQKKPGTSSANLAKVCCNGTGEISGGALKIAQLDSSEGTSSAAVSAQTAARQIALFSGASLCQNGVSPLDSTQDQESTNNSLAGAKINLQAGLYSTTLPCCLHLAA
jgi:hypothetical protein